MPHWPFYINKSQCFVTQWLVMCHPEHFSHRIIVFSDSMWRCWHGSDSETSVPCEFLWYWIVSIPSFICFLFFSKWAMLIKQKWCFIQLTTEKLHSPGMCLLRSQIRWVICSKFDFSLREECRPKKISPLNINMHEYAVNGLNCVQRVTIAALHVRFALQIFTPGGPFLTQSPWDLCLLLETKQGSSTC